MLKTPALFILSLLAFLVISGITASASLPAPFLPDLQHLQPEILAESADSDTFLVFFIPADRYDYQNSLLSANKTPA